MNRLAVPLSFFRINDSAVHDSASNHPLLTRTIQEALDLGDVELLELLGKHQQTFILRQRFVDVR